MAELITLNKNVFTKNGFTNTVDTSFTQLVGTSNVETPTIGVDEFFNLYEELFFQIPKEGIINSHTYLVERSGAYIEFDRVNEEIQVLLNEISQLRQENLSLNQRLEELNTI
jgi:hypothetical protein